MKFRVFALFFVICALWGIANANDKISFYLECSQGQKCIDFAYENGKKVSALQTPAQEVTKADIQSAIVNAGGNALPSLTIELSKEASEKFGKITGENIGKKLIVILNDKVLTAPTINAPITSRKIIISGEAGSFWEKTPWLQEVITLIPRAAAKA